MRDRQLAIFVRPQWYIGSTSTTHIADILDNIKPLWTFLVNSGPDKNPRHLKNIYQYCKLFCFLNLDYLTIRTHASGQLAYNPIERSMTTLSEKLAEITLPIDKYGTHFSLQRKVQDIELGLHNFCYTGERLCELRRKDLVFEKPIFTKYTDQSSTPFIGMKFSEMINEQERQ
ncbi:28136_t:CDS:2 [Gigaspora margarita]|uniref:28136_t:CDS:1 n=1 Tax=Gigaspora margarita TaxID=4874 RepID=A0ABN7VWG2_GIGMA|nr:28136_t:CDS:2 [Gigaspora margarita]